MDRFQAMQVFTRVVDVNSFTRAAETLSLPRTTVTTTIQTLERRLGVRLLNRTTRRLSLTPDGAAYYDRCVRILADVEETEAAFMETARRPKGRLRIDVHPSIGRLMLIPALCDFHHRFPDIELAIGMADRPVDMVQEGVDCVIRGGNLPDSSLVARRIGTFQMVIVGAPSYLASFGEPGSLAALEEHFCVQYFSSTGRPHAWELVVDGKPVEAKIRSTISVNDSEAYVACALQGFGLIQVPRFMVQRQLEAGELVELFPQWKPAPLPISVLYPHNRHLSPKVRAFSDWVAELFQQCPLLGGQHPQIYGECEFECGEKRWMGIPFERHEVVPLAAHKAGESVAV